TDVALTGGIGWSTLPVAFSQGNGSFSVKIGRASCRETFATQPGAKIVTGDFNGDGRTDVALTGGTSWITLPVAFSQGNGSFSVTNHLINDSATFPHPPATHNLTADVSAAGRTDVALTGGTSWISLPVAFSQGNGSFSV